MGAGNACLDSNYVNYPVFEYYGYDPNFLEDQGITAKEFHWFKDFPTNNHMEYDGKILQGRMMANAYIRTFTDDELTAEWLEDDIGTQFPFYVCDPDVNDGKPSDENICWMDLREEEDREEATCAANAKRMADPTANVFISRLAINDSSRASAAGKAPSGVSFLVLVSSAVFWFMA